VGITGQRTKDSFGFRAWGIIMPNTAKSLGTEDCVTHRDGKGGFSPPICRAQANRPVPKRTEFLTPARRQGFWLFECEALNADCHIRHYGVAAW